MNSENKEFIVTEVTTDQQNKIANRSFLKSTAAIAAGGLLLAGTVYGGENAPEGVTQLLLVFGGVSSTTSILVGVTHAAVGILQKLKIKKENIYDKVTGFLDKHNSLEFVRNEVEVSLSGNKKR